MGFPQAIGYPTREPRSEWCYLRSSGGRAVRSMRAAEQSAAVGLALSPGPLLVEKAMARFALRAVVPVIFATIRTGPAVNAAPAEA